MRSVSSARPTGATRTQRAAPVFVHRSVGLLRADPTGLLSRAGPGVRQPARPAGRSRPGAPHDATTTTPTSPPATRKGTPPGCGCYGSQPAPGPSMGRPPSARTTRPSAARPPGAAGLTPAVRGSRVFVEPLSLTGRDVGTPIIQFNPPAGTAFFGPVISRPPEPEDAVRLWGYVTGLAGFPGFAELKRSVRERPQLPSFGVSQDTATAEEDRHAGSRRPPALALPARRRLSPHRCPAPPTPCAPPGWGRKRCR